MQPFPLTFSVSFSNFQAKGNVEWPFCPWVKIGMNPLRGTKKENINKFEFCYDKKQHQRHKLSQPYSACAWLLVRGHAAVRVGSEPRAKPLLDSWHPIDSHAN